MWPTKSCCIQRIPERVAWLYQLLFTPHDVLCLQTTGGGGSLANHVNAFEDSEDCVADKPAWPEEDCCSFCLKSLFSLNNGSHSYCCPCTLNHGWTSAKQDVALSPVSSKILCTSSTCNSYGDPNSSSSFSFSALPWVRPLVAGFSQRRPGFYPKQVHVKLMMCRGTMTGISVLASDTLKETFFFYVILFSSICS